MLGQTWPSRFWTPLPQKRRHGGPPERPANRAVGAAIVAGGPFSVSLYPLPDGPSLPNPFAPNRESSSDSQKLAGAKFVSYKNSGSFTLKLADMVKLVALNHDFPGFGADGLLDLAMTYGMPDVVRSVQLIGSMGPLRHGFPSASRGGGGGGGGPSDVPGELWPALMWLLDFLEQNPPSLSDGDGLRDLITNVFPKLAVSLGIPIVPAAPPPEAQVSILAAAPEFTPIEVPNLAVPDPPVSGFAQAPVSAPVEGAAPASVDSAAPASVEPSAPAPTEVPVSVSVEAPVSVPDPPSVSVPEPDPPSSDPPSSPGGGTATSSAGDSSGGSVGSSSGGSAGSSSGGSAASSGGSSDGSSGTGSAGSSGRGSDGSSGGGPSGGE
jgi:hypothetical protein